MLTLTFGIDYRPNWSGPGLVLFNDLFTSNFWHLPDSDIIELSDMTILLKPSWVELPGLGCFLGTQNVPPET